MATIEMTRPAPFGAIATLDIVNFFDNAVSEIKARLLAHKTETMLNSLSDRQLEDIGLERSQIVKTTMEIVTRRYF